MKREIDGPIATQVYIPIDLQFCIVELRAADNTHLRTLRDCVDGEVACQLVIESEVVKVERGIDDRLFECAGASRSKAHPALDGYAAALEGRDSRQIKICSCGIQTEGMRRKMVSCIACNTSILLKQLDIIEPCFPAFEMQPRSYLQEWFAV